ncbi:unnamed protein product [Triticum turgidum subsp. durum]|uniref:Uncharacterized protein n=1 Tax=Triticum turgidum subsp. durum TaxID=4567 RepID=A0A9R1P286_TRITD|nr:unnamed protein product [Triticum turgidum subsp. durum]
MCLCCSIGGCACPLDRGLRLLARLHLGLVLLQLLLLFLSLFLGNNMYVNLYIQIYDEMLLNSMN